MSETRVLFRRTSFATATRPLRQAPPARAPAPAPSPVIVAPSEEEPSIYVPAEIPLRFLREVGTRAVRRLYWGNDCPNAYGQRRVGGHNAEQTIGEVMEIEAWDRFPGLPREDDPAATWPTICDHCGATAPGIAPDDVRDIGELGRRVINKQRLYQAPDGELVTDNQMCWGDALYSRWLHADDGTCHYWTNCTQPHVHVVLPPHNHPWDVMSRASNCTLRDDKTHRCWCTSGSIEDGTFHVTKEGETCAAGAGSIQVTGYHGHVVHGVLKKC